MTEETIKEILKFRTTEIGNNFTTRKIWQSPFRWRQQSYWKYSSGAVRISQMKENRKR